MHKMLLDTGHHRTTVPLFTIAAATLTQIDLRTFYFYSNIFHIAVKICRESRVKFE